MEVDKRTTNDASDAYMTPDATEAQGSIKNRARNRSIEIAHPTEDGLKKGSLNVKVLKMTSGNITKWLRTRQETQATTQASQNAAITTSQMATKRHAEMFCMNKNEK